MTLTLYNTLTRGQEAFETVEPGKVKMYYCGVTVYDYCHLGHARACIVWDGVRRYLDFIGYEVRYVQNFTDVDDKILNRARLESSSMEAVADRFIKAYFEDMARLNIKEADEYPRATHTMNGITRLIHELENKGFAYPADGDVYYAVSQFPEYGKLSRRKQEDMQAGASDRVNIEDPEYQKKKHPSDFALWKAAKPGEPAWESPWGEGRPGWHIECSAMVRDRLGDTIDIHAGGSDLIFPHHENEIAQSEAATGKPLANYWMHNGFVNIDGEKMSKSLGNFTTIRGLLETYNPMAVRLFILQSHYRTPIDFTEDAINTATKGWINIQDALLFERDFGQQLNWQEFSSIKEFSGELEIFPFNVDWEIDLTFNRDLELIDEVITRFNEAMDDDFNTPIALSVLFELAKDLRREVNQLVHQGQPDLAIADLQQQWHTLKQLAQILGLEAEPEPDTESDVLSDPEVESLIQQRQDARKAKNFVEGDRIRDQLVANGITLIDQPSGITRWYRA